MSASSGITAGLAAGAVFDRLAPTYDQDFTESLIGRAQRKAVWQTLLESFHPGDHILELNCGTGEDAFFLAANGISLTCCDASTQMIARAQQRLYHKQPPQPITFSHLPTERIAELAPTRFDGAFSNFSGLNCIADLTSVASDLSTLIHPGGSVVLCLSTRVCFTEISWYAAHGQFKKALRRCKGHTQATLDGITLPIFYPTVTQIRRSFSPHFRLRGIKGIGVVIPPSYLEHWAVKHPALFRVLCRLESHLGPLPLFRITGDHVLLRFEKVSA